MKRQRTASAMDEAIAGGITMSELRKGMAQVIVRGYHDLPHGGIGKSPLEAWDEGVDQFGAPRQWPTDATGALRLAHLRLIDGGVRKREHGHVRFIKRDYIPFKPGMPEEVRVLHDPHAPEVIALYDAGGRVSGRYCGDAYATGTLHVSHAPSDEDEDTGGAAATSAVVAELDRSRARGSKPARPRIAAARQRQLDNATEQRVLAPTAKSQARTPLSLRRRRGQSDAA